MKLSELLELDALAQAEAKKYPLQRDALAQIKSIKGRQFVGIIGPRGVGKSILLRQLAAELDHSFYGSVDTFRDAPLFDLAKELAEKLKIGTLLLDEVHFRPGFDGELKKIYDFLPDVHVVFTSSMALALQQSAYDLSRRIRLIRLPPFSFREFIRFKTGSAPGRLGWEDIDRRSWTPEHARFEYLFEPYLQGGLMPFSLAEPDPLRVLRGIVDTVIERDIPRVGNTTFEETEAIRRALTFIGRSEVDGINPSSVARNLAVSRYKAAAFIDLLSKAFILIPVEPEGSNVLREPKVLMQIPYRLLYRPWQEALGALREDFFAAAMIQAEQDIRYLKSTTGRKTPDFRIMSETGDLIVEIGGAGKGRSQFKGFHADRKIVLSHAAGSRRDTRPLFMAGYLA